MTHEPHNNPEPTELEQLTALATGELHGEQAEILRARINADPVLGAGYEKIVSVVRFLQAEPNATPSSKAITRAKRALAESRPGAVERLAGELRRVIASLDLDTRLTPAVAGIRGAGATAQLAFSTEADDIDLQLVAVSKESWKLTGQIDSDQEGDWLITIENAAGEQAVAEIHSITGAFHAELPAGSYLIRLCRDDLMIEVGPVLVP